MLSGFPPQAGMKSTGMKSIGATMIAVKAKSAEEHECLLTNRSVGA
jgi:hypothetical protein